MTTYNNVTILYSFFLTILESDEFAGREEGMYAVRKKIQEENDSYLPLSLPYPAEDVQTFEKAEKSDCDRITLTDGDALLGTYTAGFAERKAYGLGIPSCHRGRSGTDRAGGRDL